MDVLLAGAEHPLDLVRRPVLVRTGYVEENLGVFGRILHAHAAVAVGAHIVREHVLVRRVVLVDQEAIGEVEPYATERVGFARRLIDVHAAIAIVDELEAHSFQRHRVALQHRHIFVVYDRRRHVPGRIDGDVFHRLAKQRRRHVRLADHDSGAPDLGVVVHHPQREVRQIDDHVGLAEIARIPAPALHIGDDGVDLLVARRTIELLDGLRIEIAGDRQFVGALEFLHRLGELGVVSEVGGIPGQAELVAQQRNARVFHRSLGVELEQLAVGDLFGTRGLGAHLREHGLELLVALVGRAEFVERCGGVGGLGELGEDLRRIGRLLRQLDVLADAGIGEAAGLQVTGISEHCLRELEFGFGQRVRAQAGKGWRLVVVDVEAVGIGALQARNDGLGASILHAFVEPQGGEVATLIERLDGRALSLASENRIALGCQQVANLFRHRAVGGIERGQRIGCRCLLAHDGGIGRRRGDRGVFGPRRSLARCSGRRTRRSRSFTRRHCRRARRRRGLTGRGRSRARRWFRGSLSRRSRARRRCSLTWRGRSRARRARVLRKGGGANRRREDQSQSRARQNAL